MIATQMFRGLVIRSTLWRRGDDGESIARFAGSWQQRRKFCKFIVDLEAKPFKSNFLHLSGMSPTVKKEAITQKLSTMGLVTMTWYRGGNGVLTGRALAYFSTDRAARKAMSFINYRKEATEMKQYYGVGENGKTVYPVARYARMLKYVYDLTLSKFKLGDQKQFAAIPEIAAENEEPTDFETYLRLELSRFPEIMSEGVAGDSKPENADPSELARPLGLSLVGVRNVEDIPLPKGYWQEESVPEEPVLMFEKVAESFVPDYMEGVHEVVEEIDIYNEASDLEFEIKKARGEERNQSVLQEEYFRPETRRRRSDFKIPDGRRGPRNV